MDLDLRDALIEEYAPEVDRCALHLWHKLGGNPDLDDLKSDAALGLIQAAESWKGGYAFRAWAYIRMRGQILDGVRERRFIGRGAKDDDGNLMKDPSFQSLDAKVARSQNGSEELTLHDVLADPYAEQEFDEAEIRVSYGGQVAPLMGRLPERERCVLTLYYYENLTLKEIATFLGVTESRASQIKTKALHRCRAWANKEAA